MTIWKKLADELGVDVDHVIKWHGYMRDRFGRMEKQLKSGCATPTRTAKDKWIWTKCSYFQEHTYTIKSPSGWSTS